MDLTDFSEHELYALIEKTNNKIKMKDMNLNEILNDLTEHELYIFAQEITKALEKYKNNENIKVYYLLIPYRECLTFIKLESLLQTVYEFSEMNKDNNRCWLLNEEKDETKTEIGIKYVNKRDLKYCEDYER